MKIIGVLFLTLLIFSESCSSGREEIISSRISRVSRDEYLSRNPTDKVMKDVALKIIKNAIDTDQHHIQIQLGEFRRNKSDISNPVIEKIKQSLKRSLVKLSEKYNVRVVDQNIKKSDSTEGERIVQADYNLSGMIEKLSGYKRVIIYLERIRSKENKAVFQSYIPDSGGNEWDEFIVSENIAFDTVTGISWERLKNSTYYKHKTAIQYCSSLILEGYDDWRIPGESEFFTVIARKLKKKEKLLNFSYGMYGINPGNQNCHWLRKDSNGSFGFLAGDLENGKITQPIEYNTRNRNGKMLECQIKCVRGFNNR